jgi:hypothetical protein
MFFTIDNHKGPVFSWATNSYFAAIYTRKSHGAQDAAWEGFLCRHVDLQLGLKNNFVVTPQRYTTAVELCRCMLASRHCKSDV